MIDIRQLDAADRELCVAGLAEVLLDCVRGGASVSFMAGITLPEAKSFFDGIFGEVERGSRILLAALAGDAIVGTIQVLLSMPPNQPHRADIAKLLVRRSARGQGVGQLLMERAEQASRALGKRLLVLDTASEAAERLYERMGWTRVGLIPKYAYLPDGEFCSTAIYWKWLD